MRAIIITLLVTLIVLGLQPRLSPAAEPASEPLWQPLIGLVPKSAESVFCTTGPTAIESKRNLSEASTIQIGQQIATSLTLQWDDVLRFKGRKVTCCLSIVRHIRPPLADESGVAMGLLRSERCELLLLSDALPDDWPDKIAEGVRSKTFEENNIKVCQLANDAYAAQLNNRLVCVCNERALLSEVIALVGNKDANAAKSLIAYPRFREALSLMSNSTPMWAIRVFPDGEVDDDDITSVKVENSIVGVHDKQVSFVAFGVNEMQANKMSLYYASDEADVVSRRMAESLGVVDKIDMVRPNVDGAKNSERRIAAMRIHLRDSESAPLVFMGICVLCGQGMLP